MATKENPFITDCPTENFSRGLFRVEIPELDAPIHGKVRDNWVVEKKGKQFRLMVTTDRQSAFVRTVCTVPGKGQVSNLTSAFWFEQTNDIIPNHMVAVLHPNVLFAKQAKTVIPIEVVLRRYMARGSSSTSLYRNYTDLGRREIYGIKFPENLHADQELPMGTIVTPTTKARNGYDEELTDDQACKIVDSNTRSGVWNKIKSAAFDIFERARVFSLDKGLILADTKMEFGLDDDGNLMLIDELLTPECSRFWPINTYDRRLSNGEDRDNDKDVLIRWLIDNKFAGEGVVPQIPVEIIDQMTEIYAIPYRMIVGGELSPFAGVRSVGKIALQYIQGFLNDF